MTTLGGLVHVFNILETKRLQKYTTYKIQMISFPKNESLFQSLTKLTVTKRYSDFKKLEDNLLSTYKGYNFRIFFKSDSNYFNRFNPEVIEQRKRTILDYLYYCAEHTILYRSQYFVKFFDDSTVQSNIDEISETLRNRDESPEESINSIEEDVVTVEEALDSNELKTNDNDIDYYLCGYLYDAALNFSHAVQEEANLRYKNAFELYKSGIDKLLTGAKSDTNELRKGIAKTKASKYLEKAEQLYENYILEQQENEFLIEEVDSKETQSSTSLECPLNYMSRYKVIQINQRLMKVQDRTDKKIYILKVIWKSHSHKVLFMPQNIPFMCPLISYFHSENAIFLLLPYVSGGLLWNYINSYSSISTTMYNDIEELFVEPPRAINGVDVKSLEKTKLDVAQLEIAQDSIELINECVNSDNDFISVNSRIEDPIDSDLYLSSFDKHASDIDIDDLMKCSQQLLKSVTKTLEKSAVITEFENNEIDQLDELKNQAVMKDEMTIVGNHLKIDAEEPVTIVLEESHCESIPETVLRKWACEIIICINSLHKNGIILGDLNLDNLLLGSNGHILLTYFCHNSRSNYQQLCELDHKAVKCQYVAFEFPLTRNSDYYSVGIILYEIFTKNRFYTYHPAGISKYNEIQYSEICQLSAEARDFLDVLIFRKYNHDAPFESIKSHPFFDGIDFNEIETFGYE